MLVKWFWLLERQSISYIVATYNDFQRIMLYAGSGCYWNIENTMIGCPYHSSYKVENV